MMLKYEDVIPLARAVRVIVRNSAACKQCGVELNCTDEAPDTWMTHECEEGWFAIRGGTNRTEHNGSMNDFKGTWQFKWLVGLNHKFNPETKGYWAPEETVKCA